jgi:Rrf2 family protein
MLTLPQTAEYALRAVCYIAEHEEDGPVPVSSIATALGAPRNYLSKLLHQLGASGVLRSTRGVRGGYHLGRAARDIRLLQIVGPYLPVAEHRCIMGHTRCGDEVACGAHRHWKEVKETARRFFAEFTIADLLAGAAMPGPAAVPARAAPQEAA